MDFMKLTVLLTGCFLIGCAKPQPSRFLVVRSEPLSVPSYSFSAPSQREYDQIFHNEEELFCYFADPQHKTDKENLAEITVFVCQSENSSRSIAELTEAQLNDTNEKIVLYQDLFIGSSFVYVSEQTPEITVLSSCAADRPPKTLKLPFVYVIQRVIGSSQYLVAYRYTRDGVFAYILDQDLNVRWKFEAPGVPEIPDKLLMVSDRAMSYTVQVRLGDSVARNLTEEEGKEFVARLSQFEGPKAIKPDVSWRIADGRLYLKDLATQLEAQIDIKDKVLTATILPNKKQIVALARSKYYIISCR